MTKEAWGYVRLSQDGRDGTLEGQKEQIRDYVRASEELELITTLNEGKNTSGFNSDRSRYQRIKSKVQNNELDAIVVRDRKRLNRDFDERVSFDLLCRQNAVEIHVVEERGRIGLDQPLQFSLEVIQAAVDHKSKIAEIERAKSAVQERQEKGYWQGRPPFGLEFDANGQFLVPGNEFETALEVLELASEDVSYYEIEKETDVPTSTVGKIVDKAEMYLEHAE